MVTNIMESERNHHDQRVFFQAVKGSSQSTLLKELKDRNGVMVTDRKGIGKG